MAESRKDRNAYRVFYELATRWRDNDIYGHVNNVVYYEWFDSAANRLLIEHGGLDIHNGESIAFVVSSGCDYHAPVAYPDHIEVGITIAKLGNSSLNYELAIFKRGEDSALASGHFVHVFVDRHTQKPRPIPETMRAGIRPFCKSDDSD